MMSDRYISLSLRTGASGDINDLGFLLVTHTSQSRLSDSAGTPRETCTPEACYQFLSVFEDHDVLHCGNR
jgi:hypothetical protein